MAAEALRAAICVAMATTMLAEGGANMIPTFAGPYIAYPDKFYQCSPAANGRIRDNNFELHTHSHFKPNKPFESILVSGVTNFTSPLDNTWWAQADIAIRSNNQWKEHAFVMKFPNVGCNAFRDHAPSLFSALYRRLGDSVMKNRPCVVPPGSYSFDPQPIDWAFPTFPVFPYGHYRCKIMLGYRGETQEEGCTIFEAHVIPKPR